ncbi:dehydrogenase/reductase SDR family member 11-like [Eriocheir sinensis]|uniref:dehydrogenase/reductase SDR family member 11-like n=1 Tax=Eriocheir sinensis TaxID=95602 RepID=UPI0021C7DD26|nr:dehydrogenase/reductase SDR family member 11-like [Eriocheir sinensis]
MRETLLFEIPVRMERWSGRVALVTGASMGIGASVARRLVAEGMKVVGAARSIDKLQALASELKGQRGTLIPIKCDLTKDEEVLAMFAKIKKDLGGVDVCINNAGFTHNKSLLEGSPKEWREMMDLNVVALCLCTRESIASMRERSVDDGHIIHISSFSGHRVTPNKAVHFYSATKYSVTALTEGLRQELREANSNIRISAISPGLVETEFIANARLAEDANAAKKFYKERGSLSADDITATLVHILSAPPHVQIHDVLIRRITQAL